MRKPWLLSVCLAGLIALEPDLTRARLYAQGSNVLTSTGDTTAVIKDFDRRAQVVIDAAACGHADKFLEFVGNVGNANTPDDKLQREELTGLVIGKIFKYYQLLGQRFAFRPNVPLDPPICTATPEVLRERLKAEVNQALRALPDRAKKAGSSELPCYGPLTVFAGLTEGEYDVVLRNLVRILHMRPKWLNGTQLDVLEDDVLKDVRDTMLTLGGNTGRQSYSIYECGNEEDHTGTPEEVAEDYEFAADFGDALEDIGEWILNALKWLLLLVILAILVAAGLGAALAAMGGGAAAVAVAAAVATAALFDEPFGYPALCAVLPGLNLAEACRIAETENHLLMMETSRYLTNQVRADYLKERGHDVPSQMNNDANDLREWMLEHFQGFLTNDFIEYNARPYQRYSVNAVLNMYDFAEDPQLRLAAGMVLDYLSAKFAVGSINGRRVVPFRRLTDAVSKTDLFEAVNGADHQVNRFLVLSGQAGLLDHGQLLTIDRTLEMIPAAVSNYRLPAAVLDLARDKSTPYSQLIRHDGVEIYAASRGFLLSAGGVTTGPAYKVGTLGRPADQGAALPTVLIPAAGGKDRNELIRFDGGEDHDGNTCVTEGFACGLNPVVPFPADNACRTDDGRWIFVNSARCAFSGAADPAPHNDPLENAGPYFFVALYKAPCSGGCEGSWGFLEAVDVDLPPGVDPAVTPAATFSAIQAGFAAFMTEVKADNPTGTRPAGPSLPGLSPEMSYVRRVGGGIFFSPFKPKGEWGVRRTGPNQLDDWKLGQFGPLSANNGVVAFGNPRTPPGPEFTLDFSNVNNPRTVPPVIERSHWP